VIEGYATFPAPLPEVDHAKMECIIERALEEACPVRLVYHTTGRGERTERVVEPLRIDERGGARYLVAYCRLRQDERVFRLDRVESAVLQGDG
jgi:predicted DNA-binding transcriptional regulator YafY